MKRDHLQHRFVEFIPEQLDEGVLYVSVEYMTVAHKCCCGCGREVSLPLSPTDWRLIFDGKSISLEPSIGSWSLPCKSHYWITNNRVRWAAQWSPAQVQAARTSDARRKSAYFGKATKATTPTTGTGGPAKEGRWERFKAIFRWK